jgi:hypothetical protein
VVSLTIRSFGWRVAYFFPEGGVTGSGPRGETLIGDSGSVGAISAPASFTALNVVPGGVSGGRLSMIRFVWFTRSRTAAEITATIAAITTGFRMTISIPVNGHLRCGVPALKVPPYLQKVAGPKETANRFPQWCFLPVSLNSRNRPRFSARMTAIRASVVRPLRDPSRRLHCNLPIREVGFFFRQAGDVIGGVP